MPGFAVIAAPLLTFLFTGRDTAVTMNSSYCHVSKICLCVAFEPINDDDEIEIMQ